MWECISRISVSFHKVPKYKQLHLNHCQLQIIMENGSLYQSNWHTFLYISVSEDSRIQLMVHFTLWRIMFIRKTPFTCSPNLFGWMSSLCNISCMQRNREVCASCRGQKISILETNSKHLSKLMIVSTGEMKTQSGKITKRGTDTSSFIIIDYGSLILNAFSKNICPSIISITAEWRSHIQYNATLGFKSILGIKCNSRD